MSKLGVLLGCVAVTFAIGGCRPDPPEPAPMGQFADGLLKLPEGWSAPEFPEDNAFTDARWALGKDLFFDERLSVDGSVSCAS